jgi:hypothetical protein
MTIVLLVTLLKRKEDTTNNNEHKSWKMNWIATISTLFFVEQWQGWSSRGKIHLSRMKYKNNNGILPFWFSSKVGVVMDEAILVGYDHESNKTSWQQSVSQSAIQHHPAWQIKQKGTRRKNK